MPTTIRDVGTRRASRSGQSRGRLRISRACPRPRVNEWSKSRSNSLLRLRVTAHAHSPCHVSVASAAQQFFRQPVFSHVLNGFEEACRERKLVPSVLTAGPTQDLAQQMRLHAPDVYCGRGFRRAGTARASSFARAPDGAHCRRCSLICALGFRSLSINNVKGAQLTMRHLFAAGRRRVAFIGGSLAHHSIAQRALGYRKAYFDAGSMPRPVMPACCSIQRSKSTRSPAWPPTSPLPMQWNA